ncbi:EamA family transporter [Pararhizobium sp. LjRoot238]|uniref:EamA family transporter n=1 Tax=Pararhizobium sp. LjRoot238 TaxID=3342293 RepID=UPI003ED12392
MLKSEGGRLSLADTGLLILVAFVWGFNFVVIAVGLNSFPPLLFSALRFLVCALPAVFLVPRPAVRLRDLVGLGVVLGILLFAFLFVGIHAGMPAGLASLVMQSQVFFTVVLGVALLGERPRPLNWFAIVIGFFGIALIASERGSFDKVSALMFILAGALSWGVANLMMKKMPKTNMMHLMVWISLIPPVPLILLSLALDGWPAIKISLVDMSWRGIGAILYTGLLSTIFAYGVWGNMLQRYQTVAVAPFALLIPLFGLVSASVFLGEQHGVVDVVASFLVVTALAINVWTPQLEAFFQTPAAKRLKSFRE